MPLRRISDRPSASELETILAALPADGICRVCGRWTCSDCGAVRSLRNRYSERPQGCSSCGSHTGQMLPSRHRNPVDHFISFLNITAEGDQTARYPVAEPITDAAHQLIAGIRGSSTL